MNKGHICRDKADETRSERVEVGRWGTKTDNSFLVKDCLLREFITVFGINGFGFVSERYEEFLGKASSGNLTSDESQVLVAITRGFRDIFAEQT